MTKTFTDEEIKEILELVQNDKHTQYIGARYVPIFGRKGESTITWDNNAPYEPLTIVLHEGNSYTSRQYVPTGIDITNTIFWANTGNYNAQIEQYRKESENKLTTVVHDNTVKGSGTTADPLKVNLNHTAVNNDTGNTVYPALAKNKNTGTINGLAFNAGDGLTAYNSNDINVGSGVRLSDDIQTSIRNNETELKKITPYVDNLSKIGYNSARRFVIFGDSWATTLSGVNIPEKAITDSGAGIVKNYGVAGALLGTQSQTGNTLNTQAQIDTAKADTTVNKATVTDVLVLAGVNNTGCSWKPTYEEAQNTFNAFKIYPNARYWYVANNSRAINLANTGQFWNDWIPMFQLGAQSVGFSVSNFSPFWTHDTNWAAYWDGSDSSNRHMNATGGIMFAGKLQGLLNGTDSVPTCKINWGVDPAISTKIPSFAIHDNATVFDGHKVHVYVTTTGSGNSGTTDLTSCLYTAVEFAPCYNTQYLNCQYYSDSNLIFGGMAAIKPDGHIYINGPALKNNQGFIVISGDYDIRY